MEKYIRERRLHKDSILPYNQWVDEVRKANISSCTEYLRLFKNHAGWPSDPCSTYKKKFTSWPYIIGKSKVRKKKMVETFDEWFGIVLKLKIKSWKGYLEKARKHPRLPTTPGRSRIKNEWPGWSKVLRMLNGQKFLSYRVWLNQLRASGIKGFTEYTKKYKKYPGWPSSPRDKYPGKWPGWSQYNFNPKKHKDNSGGPLILKFNLLKQKVRKAKVNSYGMYASLRQKHGWPSYPPRHYKEWKGWADFLGIADARKRRKYLSYKAAKRLLKKEKIQTVLEYKALKKKDKRLPSNPKLYFKIDWVDWWDFVSKDKLRA